MTGRGKHRRRGYTRVGAKNQVTLPVEALQRAGIRTGDTLRAEARGPGEVLLLVSPHRRGPDAAADPGLEQHREA
jgi:bifunctional DNA-binding transcriptional regulator/antitoxin component of YhaV-PrlF toxin-antitoxin module